jgi:hypothetical protein
MFLSRRTNAPDACQEDEVKKLVAPLLLIAALVSGCGASAVAPAVQPGVVVPPSGDQRTALLTELVTVNPALSDDRAIFAATEVCRDILRGGAESGVIHEAQSRFISSRVLTVSEAEAGRIVEAIKANGFCTKK